MHKMIRRVPKNPTRFIKPQTQVRFYHDGKSYKNLEQPTFESFFNTLFPPSHIKTYGLPPQHCTCCMDYYIPHTVSIFECSHCYCRMCTAKMYMNQNTTCCPLCRSAKKTF